MRSDRVFTGGEEMRASPETALGCAALNGATFGDTDLEDAFGAGVFGAAIGPSGTGGLAMRGPWESDAGLMLKKLASNAEHNKNVQDAAASPRATLFNLAYCTPQGSCQTFPSPVKASENA